MKLTKILVLAAAAVLLTELPVLAAGASVELGKKLFFSPGVGGSTNGKTCNTCHLGGKKLEKAGANKTLGNTINRCILGPLAGKKLDGTGVETNSLKMYVESLAQSQSAPARR
jgi:cytochrome c peroxidase